MYRYKVANGIKVVTIKLMDDLTSHMSIAGHKVLMSYEWQPGTCYAFSRNGSFVQSATFGPHRKGTNLLADGSNGILQYPTPTTANVYRLRGFPNARSVDGLPESASSGALRELSDSAVVVDGPSQRKKVPVVGRTHSSVLERTSFPTKGTKLNVSNFN